MKLFWNLIKYFMLAFLHLRYKIEIKGLEQIERNKKGGILFLPNHTAHMDPLFLFILLFPKYRMRPIVTEYIARISFIKPLMKITKGIVVPSLATSVNPLKMKKAKDAIQQVVDSLKAGSNFILYPSGKLKETAKETVAGTSGAHEIMQQYPETTVVLIRTTGLWGSSFSRAITNESPDLPKTLLQGMKTLLKNGIFFAPRRKVLIEIETEPKNFPRQENRVEFNRYLENWYNQYPVDGKRVKEEPLTLVSYSFWRKDVPEIAKREEAHKKAAIAISPETKNKVFKEIRRIMGNANLNIEPQMNLASAIGMDSLNIAELIGFLAQKFDIGEVHPEDIVTVLDVLEVAERSKKEPKAHEAASIFSFPEEKTRKDPLPPLGENLAEAFLNICERMGDSTSCGDDLSGVTSYKKIKKTALVLAQYFKELPEEKIAVLLPASTGVYVVIFALLLANKVPVMLNWTLGPRYLEEMMRLSRANKIISSWRFIDRASNVDFGNTLDQFELLEDIRDKLGLKRKLKGLFLSLLSAKGALKRLQLVPKNPEDTAVILFTSGTEAMPKGVPLSHKNILSNQKSMLQCIDLKSSDSIYSILPPFHSFGFTVAGTLPILCGLKVAFFPDPTDSYALAEGVQRWKVTLFSGAPNFIKGLLFAAKPHALDSVRLFISGAEKASLELYDTIAKLGTHAILVEGYGITECAPALSLNRLHLPPRGVGHLLPGIEACTIHPETAALLPKGSEGEICVRGPNVFSGYLENPRSPFIEIEGKKWYRTGDIGYFDQDGYLILSGRLKRFTKLGGEMISLGAIENVLIEALVKRGVAPPSDSSLLAVCADEKPDQKPEIIVFTITDLSQEEANTILSESGLSRLIKVSKVRKVVEIPLLGTGKTNYRELQKRI